MHEHDSFDNWENTPPKESVLMSWMKSGNTFEVAEKNYPYRNFFFRFDKNNLSLQLIRGNDHIPVINQIDVLLAFERGQNDVDIYLRTHQRPNYIAIDKPLVYM